MRDELARDLGLDAATSTGPLLDSLLQRATSSSLTPYQQPVSSASLTSTPRQHQENSDALTRTTNTTLSAQTQPIAGSVPAKFTNDSRLFANPTLTSQAETISGVHCSPFDQFSKPGSLLPLTTSNDAGTAGSSFILVHKTTKVTEFVSGPAGPEEDRISASQGQAENAAGVPTCVKVEKLSSGEEQVNGKDVDELFGNKLNVRYGCIQHTTSVAVIASSLGREKHIKMTSTGK